MEIPGGQVTKDRCGSVLPENETFDDLLSQLISRMLEIGLGRIMELCGLWMEDLYFRPVFPT